MQHLQQRATLALIGALACLTLAVAAPDLSKSERKRIQQQIGQLAGDGDWRAIGPLIERLGGANDKATFKFIVKVVEKAPAGSGLGDALRSAAEQMDDRRVQAEIKRAATKSRSVEVRRALIALVTEQGDWETLIEVMKDDDEQVAAAAAWKLIDERVEAAIEPMIVNMERLDRSQGHIWDVYKNGLGRVLGQRCGSGVEYRSLWTLVQERGGLSSVDRSARPETGGGGGGGSVTLFGREIDCTRIVFVLDFSGSMKAIDANQADPLAVGGSRSRDPGGSEAPDEGPGRLTRLQRAQIALKNVIDHLPKNYKINIVGYSSRTKLWRGISADGPPVLHPLTDATREEAKEWIDKLRPEGVTVTHHALADAFKVEGARCFYLLSDGFATADGTTPIPTAEILDVIDTEGRGRHVTIHTMGFEGADRAMMEAVAAHTGGEYSDIRRTGAARLASPIR